MSDTSWQDQPGAMSPQVAEQVAQRISEHARDHDLPEVAITLHGGEPLLLGKRRLDDLLTTFDNIIKPVSTPLYSIQTNALLMTDEVLEVLDAHDVGIGVSIDGGREANDRHRKRKNGVGTYDTIAERLNSLRSGRFSHLYGGLLATIDVANDPIETYLDLNQFEPNALDFLLPHGNWDNPPPAKSPTDRSAPYAEWLIPIFDYWFDEPDWAPSIRIFDAIIRLLHNESGSFESIGLSPVALISIQTDGSYELVDTLKSAYDGGAHTGRDVFECDIDAITRLPAVASRQLGLDGLSEVCRACEVVDICGGGYYPHRYQRGRGFLNPSVFCADLIALIQHIRKRILSL